MKRSKPADSLMAPVTKTSRRRRQAANPARPGGEHSPKQTTRRPVQSGIALKAFQRLMLNAVTRRLTRDLTMQKIWTDGRPTRRIAERFVKPNDRLTSFQRLEIYNCQYWFRLLDCLYDDFPGLRLVMGERKFMALAQDYLQTHPSHSFNLRNLGMHLPGFLLRSRSVNKQKRRLFYDMASLEWARTKAFDEAARQVIDPARFQTLHSHRMRIRLQPHLTLLALMHPVDEFAVAMREQLSHSSEGAGELRPAAPAAKPPAIRSQCVFLAVYRHDNVVFFKRLEAPAYRILKHLEAGKPLGRAMMQGLATFSGQHAPAALQAMLAEWFAVWTQLGWLCRK